MSICIAISLIEQVIDLLKIKGFNLTRFTSNSRKILRNIDSTKLSRSWSTANIDRDLLTCERALCLVRNVENDKLGFQISIVDQPCTKINILSVIFSVYDPCFLYLLPL